jgi:hypothetical protein
MRCYHKLVGGHWVPTPGEGGPASAGRGGRNIDTAIARRAAGIMANADSAGRAPTSREQRHLDRLDRLAVRRQAREDAGKPKMVASSAPAKSERSLGPAYDKSGRYYPHRDPNLKPEQVAAVRAELRTKRERSRR